MKSNCKRLKAEGRGLKVQNRCQEAEGRRLKAEGPRFRRAWWALASGLQPSALSPQPSRSGFTLLEMIVVLAIFALLTGVAIPVVGVTMRLEETSSTRERMDNLAIGIRNFYRDTGRFPVDLDELITASKKVPGWSGPYVSAGFADKSGNLFYDAWQNAFQLLTVDAQTRRLRSSGMNGVDDKGTNDDIDLDVNVDTLLRDRNITLLSEMNSAIALYNANYRVAKLPPLDATGKKVKDDPKGVWHTHTYIYKGNWFSTTHRHDLSLVHSVKDLHPGTEDKVGNGDTILDIPLKGPWSYALPLLELRDVLDNSDGHCSADAWGTAFATGPDPVQYVTSGGSK